MVWPFNTAMNRKQSGITPVARQEFFSTTRTSDIVPMGIACSILAMISFNVAACTKYLLLGEICVTNSIGDSIRKIAPAQQTHWWDQHFAQVQPEQANTISGHDEPKLKYSK